MSKVVRISIEDLIKRMEDMKNGDIIDLATDAFGEGDSFEGEGWFGIMKIDLSRLDDENNVWVLSWYGGSDYPRVFCDYDNGYYLSEDLVLALKDCELLQDNYTVYIDEDDFYPWYMTAIDIEE